MDGDLTLLKLFVKGDRAALGRLAERHERALLGLAKGLLGGSHGLAEEAVQDAWVRVIASAGVFEGRSEVRTWLYRIVINRCRDIARRARRETGRGACANEPESGGADDGFDERVRDAVRRLKLEHREALMLSVHAGLTDEQASDVLGVPLGTFKSRVRAARTGLRGMLSPEVLR